MLFLNFCNVAIHWLVPSSFSGACFQVWPRDLRLPQASLVPLSPVHIPLISLPSAPCSKCPISAEMPHDVMWVTDNVSLRNPEEILGRLDKKPLSDILILVFSLVIPFRKYLFNASLVLPFSLTSFCKSSCSNPRLLHQCPRCSRPWENLSAVFSISSQIYGWVSSCITNALLYLHAAYPSIFAGTSICPFSPHLIRYCGPCASGHFSCLKFPRKGMIMNHCFSPRLIFIIPPQLLLSKSPLTWQHEQVGCPLLSVRYPQRSEAIPVPQMCKEGAVVIHTSLAHGRLKFSMRWGDHSSVLAHACFLIQ